MTPKEKSKELVWKYYHLFSVELENTIDYREAKQCALIADDYAIEFAEWCLVNNVYKSETFEIDNLFLCGLQKYDDGTDKIYYLGELLEIFKKEKGL